MAALVDVTNVAPNLEQDGQVGPWTSSKLQALNRRDLQAIAKEHGLRANQKSARLVEEILAAGTKDEEDVNMSCTALDVKPAVQMIPTAEDVEGPDQVPNLKSGKAVAFDVPLKPQTSECQPDVATAGVVPNTSSRFQRSFSSHSVLQSVPAIVDGNTSPTNPRAARVQGLEREMIPMKRSASVALPNTNTPVASPLRNSAVASRSLSGARRSEVFSPTVPRGPMLSTARRAQERGVALAPSTSAEGVWDATPFSQPPFSHHHRDRTTTGVPHGDSPCTPRGRGAPVFRRASAGGVGVETTTPSRLGPSGKATPSRRDRGGEPSTPGRSTPGRVGGERGTASGECGEANPIRELVEAEILDHSPQVSWEDIAGLQPVKGLLQEIVVLPSLRPDIFCGLRAPPRGVLLFGPPGTGKTMVAKALATETGSTFFSISASSLTSKYMGQGEKIVRELFQLARERQPSIIFLDEIDSVLCSRSSNEHEASRRLKTEFLVQFDGVASGTDDRVLVVGATNLPQELDEALRRRLVRRIYIPLPEESTRYQLVERLLTKQGSHMSEQDLNKVVEFTNGYSCSDLNSLCKDAAMCPVREVPAALLATMPVDQLRPIQLNDFMKACANVRPSVSHDNLKMYQDWNAMFGSALA
ncbi:hypothetical protein CYMTET_4951 [Cymbomonas tetramitiformis]|uniref:AAA+ ATPase domain-containing protein n=1 Tax=Cymbomonas tetramitiformis TaxID=36881 RepID=A0AAE0H064_9CHLO|nr:hypothetical protein CYMTET_4951 [Cymbomonas tetramitiformis]